MIGSTRTYAVRFDFPEETGPVFAGHHKGALGWAPSLATALIFPSEDEAHRTLENGYGESSRRYGRVVLVQAGYAAVPDVAAQREP